MSLACPKCASTDVRRLSLVYREGLVALRASPGGDAGKRSDRRRVALSRQASPPHRKAWVAWAIAAGLTLLFALASAAVPTPWGLLGGTVGAAVALVAGAIAVRGRRYNARVHPSLQARWERSFMCGRCGEVFAAV